MTATALATAKTPQELDALIRSIAQGTIFSVRFVKRTNGEVRDMVCRLNVKKGQTGGGAAYDFLEKGLMPVFDMQKQEFRCISLTTILQIKLRGEVYDFSGPEKVQ